MHSVVWSILFFCYTHLQQNPGYFLTERSPHSEGISQTDQNGTIGGRNSVKSQTHFPCGTPALDTTRPAGPFFTLNTHGAIFPTFPNFWHHNLPDSSAIFFPKEDPISTAKCCQSAILSSTPCAAFVLACVLTEGEDVRRPHLKCV